MYISTYDIPLTNSQFSDPPFFHYRTGQPVAAAHCAICKMYYTSMYAGSHIYGVIAQSQLHAHMHNPGGTAQLTHSGTSDVSLRWQSLLIQTGGDGKLYI